MAEGFSSRRWFILSAVVLAILVGIFAWVEHQRSRPVLLHHAMTAAEQSYLRQVAVSNPHMSAATNFLGDTVYYLDGQLSNKGPKTVRQLGLNLTFTDPFGQVVLRQTEYPVTPQTSPLKAGETEPLRLTFERLPAEWNQGPPAIAVSYVGF